MDQMTGAGQSPRDPCNLNGVGGSSRPAFNSRNDRGYKSGAYSPNQLGCKFPASSACGLLEHANPLRGSPTASSIG